MRYIKVKSHETTFHSTNRKKNVSKETMIEGSLMVGGDGKQKPPPKREQKNTVPPKKK